MNLLFNIVSFIHNELNKQNSNKINKKQIISQWKKYWKKLDDNNFKYIYNESGGGHTWDNWRIYLSDYAPHLFKYFLCF